MIRGRAKAPMANRKDVYMIGKDYCKLVVWHMGYKTNLKADPVRVKRILKEQKA